MDGVRLRTHEGPPENSCRPAVDVLFRSVAQVYGAGALAVVLTGMGQDGLRGCECIREAGGQVLAQDEATSVVWGMPGAVSQAGLAEKVLPLPELAVEINRRVQADSGRDKLNRSGHASASGHPPSSFMNTADFDYVRNYVREQSAIVLEPGKEYLVESRLQTLARKENFGSLDILINKLRSDPTTVSIARWWTP